MSEFETCSIVLPLNVDSSIEEGYFMQCFLCNIPCDFYHVLSMTGLASELKGLQSNLSSREPFFSPCSESIFRSTSFNIAFPIGFSLFFYIDFVT